jgi:hypothetical protein
VIRLLEPSSYEDEDLEYQNDDKQESIKIDGHDFAPAGFLSILKPIDNDKGYARCLSLYSNASCSINHR